MAWKHGFVTSKHVAKVTFGAKSRQRYHLNTLKRQRHYAIVNITPVYRSISIISMNFGNIDIPKYRSFSVYRKFRYIGMTKKVIPIYQYQFQYRYIGIPNIPSIYVCTCITCVLNFSNRMTKWLALPINFNKCGLWQKLLVIVKHQRNHHILM